MESSHPVQETQSNIPMQFLGNIIDHYYVRLQHFNRLFMVIFGVFLSLIALLSTLLSVFNLWDAIKSHGRAILLAKITEPIIALFLVFPVGLLLIIGAALNWQNGLDIYQNGLILRERNREKIWYWEDIAQFDNQITLVKFSGTIFPSRRRIILEDIHQNHLIIRNQYDRMDEMIKLLRDLILPGLFNKIRQRVRHGEEVIFHPELIATRDGLRIKENLIPWTELKINSDRKGKLRIFFQPSGETVYKSRVAKLKNLDVLIYLSENPPNLS